MCPVSQLAKYTPPPMESVNHTIIQRGIQSFVSFCFPFRLSMVRKEPPTPFLKSLLPQQHDESLRNEQSRKGWIKSLAKDCYCPWCPSGRKERMLCILTHIHPYSQTYVIHEQRLNLKNTTQKSSCLTALSYCFEIVMVLKLTINTMTIWSLPFAMFLPHFFVLLPRIW